MTPPTMLRTTLLGATFKRGWTDPIHNADLALINLDLLDQGSDDLLLGRPVRLAESFGNLPCEFLQLADHQPQFRLTTLLSSFPDALLLQARKPLPRRADPRLEFGLLKNAFFICINQSRNAPLDLVDQLPHLVHLTTVFGFCLLLTALVLDPDSRGLGEQTTNVIPDRGIQHVGTDLLVPAEPLATESIRVRARASVIGVADSLLGRSRARGFAVAPVTASLADDESLQ